MRSRRGNTGYALISVLVLVGVFIIVVVGITTFASTELSMSQRHFNSSKAFFLAEAGIERAIASLRDTGNIPAALNFDIAQTGIADDSPSALDAIAVDVTAVNAGNNTFEVTSQATVNGVTRIIRANLLLNPPSQVFDYAYFLNNWGWFFGSGITANGDVRSNGRFDFQSGPTVEGEVYAGQDIGGGEFVNGKAGTVVDEILIYQHPNSPILEMPNLQNLSYYQNLAQASGSTISIDGIPLINSVFGDDAGESGDIVLIGTPTSPIVINGPVVVTGDVIIGGTIKGQGTLYSGRNIYVVSNIEYGDPPSSPRPANDDPEVVDAWAAANVNKDVVGLAASENVVLGDYTSSGWIADNWLFSMGSEDVGQDGIPGTGDAGEGDGAFQPEYEDLDGDGVFDDDYGWSDIQTSADITSFANLPEGVTAFGDISTNNISEIEGIFYTNHSLAGMADSVTINGAIVSRDEAIVSYNSVTINYDERIHSRYQKDPNWLINLDLPFSDRVRIIGWWEEAP